MWSSDESDDDDNHDGAHSTKLPQTTKDLKKIVETEEVVVASNTLSFEDYVYCRKFIFLLVSVNNIGFRPLVRLVKQIGQEVPSFPKCKVRLISQAGLSVCFANSAPFLYTLAYAYVGNNFSSTNSFM